MLDELVQTSKSAKKVLTKADGMWGGEANAGNAFDGADRLEQLDKWAKAIALLKLMATIKIHYLRRAK